MTICDPANLYHRLGGYEAIATVADRLLPRLISDALLGRFWAHRGADGIRREKQLLIDFLCAIAGGPMYYTGRDMKTAHRGMGITPADWAAFWNHLTATLRDCGVADREFHEVLAFIESTRNDIVDTIERAPTTFSPEVSGGAALPDGQ